MIRIWLNPVQREYLQAQAQSARMTVQTRDRLEMLRLSDAGWSIPRIAQQLGWHEQTVRKVLKNFQAQGFAGLPDRPRPGRRRKVTDEHMQALEQYITHSTRAWTAPELARWLEREHGVRITPDHLNRLLHHNHASCQRSARCIRHHRFDLEFELRPGGAREAS